MIYDISYKPLLQNLCLNKVDRFVRSYDGTKNLTLFGSENIMIFTIELKSSITDIYSLYYTKTMLILMILCL